MFRNILNKIEGDIVVDTLSAEKEFIEGTLTYIDLPSNVDETVIENYAFAGCNDLTTIYIPSTYKTIRKNAFAECPNLKKITIAKNLNAVKNAPWGAPTTCEIVWDSKAKPTFNDPDIADPVDVPITTTTPTPDNYRIAMRELLVNMKKYIVKRNHPGFIFINNGGSDIFNENLDKNWSEEEIKPLYDIVNAVAIEDVFYGVDADWNMADDKASPIEVTNEFMTGIKQIQKNGLKVFIIDYCSTEANVIDSRNKCKEIDCLSFQADNRNLTTIPPMEINNSNTDSHFSFNDIENCLVLLNSEKWDKKENFINELYETNYDCFIIDLTCADGSITKKDINKLKHKKNGKQRLVICYMSLGEAENYRSYWNSDWSTTMPEWIAEENKDWKGNYKVKYWTKEWQTILFGTNDSYIDVMIHLGFDGVFLDVIDAYAYFEEKV